MSAWITGRARSPMVSERIGAHRACWAAATSARPWSVWCTSTPTTSRCRTGCRLEIARVAVRDADARPRRSAGARGVHDRRRVGRRRSRRRHRVRADRRDRARASADPARVRERQAGRHRQQGAAGERRQGAVRCRRRRRASTSAFEASVAGGIPLIRSAQGIARRRAHLAHPRHRQRHDQLHPHPDVRARVVVRRRARRGAAARVRRGRSDRRRRGVRRGGQVRDPRVDRVQHARGRGRRVPRGHRQDHGAGHRRRRRGWATS